MNIILSFNGLLSDEFLYDGQVLYIDVFSLTYPLQEAAEGDCGHFSK
jgi:hypothetical protein